MAARRWWWVDLWELYAMFIVLRLLLVQFHAVTDSVKWIVYWIISNDGEDQNGMGYNALCALLSLDCRFRVTCFAQESTCILLSGFFSSPTRKASTYISTCQPTFLPFYFFLSFFYPFIYCTQLKSGQGIGTCSFRWLILSVKWDHPFCHRQTETVLIFQLNYKNAFLIRK